jgi:hypothetical protein
MAVEMVGPPSTFEVAGPAGGAPRVGGGARGSRGPCPPLTVRAGSSSPRAGSRSGRSAGVPPVGSCRAVGPRRTCRSRGRLRFGNPHARGALGAASSPGGFAVPHVHGERQATGRVAKRWFDPKPPTAGLDRWVARPPISEVLPGETGRSAAGCSSTSFRAGAGSPTCERA